LSEYLLLILALWRFIIGYDYWKMYSINLGIVYVIIFVDLFYFG